MKRRTWNWKYRVVVWQGRRLLTDYTDSFDFAREAVRRLIREAGFKGVVNYAIVRQTVEESGTVEV